MKAVERTESRLVLQEKPWLVLLVGGLFVVAGLVVAVAAGEPWAGLGSAILGAMVILAFGNTVTATFDKTTGRFTRSVRGLVRDSDVTHPLSEVSGVGVEASPSANPSRGYRIALSLASGVRVPLTTSYSSGKAGKEQAAAAIRQFLGLRHIPPAEIPGFGDMFKLMFDPNAAERLGEMFGGPVTEYEAILGREPDNLDARRQLGLALAMQGRPREAREHFEAARALAVSRGNAALAAEIDETLRRMHDAAGRG